MFVIDCDAVGNNFHTIMATCSYTAEFGAGVVVNGLDLNTDATKVLVGGRKGDIFVFVFFYSYKCFFILSMPVPFYNA